MTDEMPGPGEPAGEIEELRARLAEQEDQLLRASAELQNQRRRAARQNEESRKFALQSFVQELLPVKDSLEQGLEAATGDAGEQAESLLQGIRMTLRLWGDLLAKSGVEEINPSGQEFDPEFHEALSLQRAPGVPPDTVLEVVQKGYLLNGRLIRPARVVVAGGAQGKTIDEDVIDAEFEDLGG